MEAQPLGEELTTGKFKSNCHLPSPCKGGLGSELANFPPVKGTRHAAKDPNGFVIPGKSDMEPLLWPCRKSSCREGQAGVWGATQCGVTAEYLPLLLIAEGRQDLSLPVVSADLLLHQALWVMPMFSRESPVLVGIVFLHLFLLTLVSEIALALNSHTPSTFLTSGLLEMPAPGCQGLLQLGLGVPSWMWG